MIEHDNIFYIRDISELGGVETFTWELVKKFKDKDIAVVYKSAHENQIKRVKKYCKAYKHTNQKIKCKVAIINYDVSIIDFINEDIYKDNLSKNDKRGIYQVVHGDYENSAYKWKPPTDPRIKQYIGVTKYICDSFKRITGLNNVTYSYNPLTIEKEPKKLVLLSATRLSPIKGKDRMIKLVNALDNAGINYVWYIFTNDTNAINSKNVIYCKPRLDIGWWFEQADYIIQLSDTEACSYTINEALFRNKPIIVTPLPYLEEIGVKDGENAYIIKFDCSNINDVVDKITKIPKFEFKKLIDDYDKIVVDGKSHYEEEKEMKAKVRATKGFEGKFDNERSTNENKIYPKAGDEWITSLERAEFLKQNGAIEIVEIIEEKPKVAEKEEIKKKRTSKK